MPPLNLVAKDFQEALLPALAKIDCGNTPWGKWATDWILCRSQSCALTSIEKGTQVLVYYLDDEPIGFGSIGPTSRIVEGVRPLAIIPQIGLDVNFQRFPPDCEWPNRLSTRILLDLLSRAFEQDYLGVVLSVHTDNKGARKLYDRVGFCPKGEPGNEYQLMFIRRP